MGCSQSSGHRPSSRRGCSAAECMCMTMCCCAYCCIPFRGGGAYPKQLSELEDLYSSVAQGSSSRMELTRYAEARSKKIEEAIPVAATWSELALTLRTGDLVLFQGASVGSILITTCTKSRWSHVGMVYTKTRGRTRAILLIESVSTPDECVDVEARICKGGVRIVDLERRLRASESPYFGVIKLSLDGGGGITRQELQERFESFYHSEGSKGYETSKMTLVKVAFDCLGHSERDTSSYFCSELVCEAYQHMGLLDPDINSSKTCPGDYWSYDLQLSRGAHVAALYFIPRIEVVPTSLALATTTTTTTMTTLAQQELAPRRMRYPVAAKTTAAVDMYTLK